MSNIKDKILHFIESQGLNKSEFFKNLDLSYSNFKGVQKNSALSSDTLSKILTFYPNLSSDWLIADKGEMLVNNSVQESTSDYNVTEPIGKRLTEYVEKQGVSIKEFATKCDIGYNNTTSLLKGRLPLGMNVLHKIKNGFPNLNAEWVLYGNGDMEINKTATISAQNNKELEQLEQINYLLSNTIKDKEKTISSLENQIALMEKLQEVTKTEESPIKSGVAK